MDPPPPSTDPGRGFCSETKTFRSIRPTASLPPVSLSLSYTAYAFSLLPSPLPSHPAFIDASSGVSLSYPDLVSQVQCLACSLRSEIGISKGHVAFILSPSCLEIPILYLALMSIGAVSAPSNPACTPAELSRQINLIGPTFFFATSSTSSKLPGHVNPVLIDSALFRSLLKFRRSPNLGEIEIQQSDPAVIQFSSGTTGTMKAAALSHRNFMAMSAGFHVLKQSERVTTLLPAPLFHSLGFFRVLNGVALGNTTVVSERLPLAEMIEVAERYKVTELATAPPVVVAMGRSEEAVRFGFPALRDVVCGGAPLTEEAAKTFRERFPHVNIAVGYGATESGIMARMAGPEEYHRLRSVGRLTQSIEAKIVDLVTGEPLSVGQQGELWIRGPSVMLGYVGDPEANALAFAGEGWLRTGDICYFDEDGFLYVVDRLKEIIKYKAYQVAPAEVEQVLQTMPGIADAAVVPFPHEEAGQIPMAYVVRQPGSNIVEADIIDFVAKQVAPYKKVRKVVFINAIPRSASGKVLRRELANHALHCCSSRL